MDTAVPSDSVLHSHITFAEYLGILYMKQSVQLYILFNNNKNIANLQG